VLPTVAAGLPEMMTEPLAGTDADTISMRSLDYGRFAALLQGKSVLAMGPGLTTHPETSQFVREVVATASLPLILDADALNAFAGNTVELKKRKSTWLAITPHPGEMARLLGCSTADVQEDRLNVARKAAADWNAYVVLKGYRTIIAAPDGQAFVNPTGNPGMATGGSGDVLTGILAGLTAQFGTEDWGRLLSLGTYVHGLAGDHAAAEVGQVALIASDIVRRLPQAFRSLLPE
jgi:NAD(P)H-hydrate epimerase